MTYNILQRRIHMVVRRILATLLIVIVFTSGCFGSNQSEEADTTSQMQSVTGSFQGNVTQVWFTVNSSDRQALKIESIYTSFCSPIDDDVDDETGDYPYECGFSDNSLKVNSTCDSAVMTLYAYANIWLPTGNCVHEFGEIGPFDEGYQHLAPYRNATWNLMYSVHPVDAVSP